MSSTNKRENNSGVWRSRWAAIGAAVAITLGGGGLIVANAAPGPASSFVPVDPVRVMDTRPPAFLGQTGSFVSPVSLDFNVVGHLFDGLNTLPEVVPAGATGVALNVTVVNSSANGFVSIRPGDAVGAPSTSNVNFEAGDIVANAVTVRLPTTGVDSGKIEITYDAYGVTGATADILIDIVGYYVGADPHMAT